MEKIKVKGKLYDIRSIQTIEPHVMQIVFVGTPPTKWGDITLYTDGGIECATLTGWTTVYRDEGQVARSFRRSRMFRRWKNYRQRKSGKSVRHVRLPSIPESM